MIRRARVGINGYGVIGKRVADAVKLQEDMELVGVADVVYDYRVRVAVERGYPVFASDPDRRPEMEAAGIPVAGTLDDLLRQAEIVVDCTPKRVGAQNRERYRAAGVKAVWQGGEKHDVAGYSLSLRQPLLLEDADFLAQPVDRVGATNAEQIFVGHSREADVQGRVLPVPTAGSIPPVAAVAGDRTPGIGSGRGDGRSGRGDRRTGGRDVLKSAWANGPLRWLSRLGADAGGRSGPVQHGIFIQI